MQKEESFQGVSEKKLYQLYVQTMVYTRGLSDMMIRGYFDHYSIETLEHMTEVAINLLMKIIEESD